jgi:hypothetical protein
MNSIKFARALRVLDYAVASGTLGYGLVTVQPLFIGFGVAGLALAHLNLSDKISQALRKYFSRESAVVSPPPPSLEVADARPATFPSQIPNYRVSGLQVGADLTSRARHSLLKSEGHLNHSESNR